MLLTNFTEIKNYRRKIEMCIAYISYEKVLYELRKYLRGREFDYTLLSSQLLVLDEVVSDMCPVIEYESHEKA